jgi:anti-anti-sigma regulatory factor
MKIRLRVPAVDDPDFVADVAHGEVSVLRLVGSADTAATAPLGALLETLHHELLDTRTREIVVDMRGLDFMCAPCFKQLVAWLARLQDLPVPARYRIRFRVNQTIAWQKHSLHALSCFDTDLIAIET